MNRFQRAFDTTVVVTAFGYANQALSLFSLPLFLSTLGTGGYGLMITVLALMGYLGFADAGLSWGSMILIAQANGRGSRAEIAHIVRHSMVLALGSGLIVVLALGATLVSAKAGWRLPMFARHPEADWLIAIAGIQLGLGLQFGVFYNLFQGLQEGYWTAIYQGLGRMLGLAGSMIIAWRTRSVASVMIVQLVFTVAAGTAATAHVWLRHRWVFSQGSWIDRSQYRAQLRVGAKNFLLQIGRTLCGTAPTLGISAIVGPAAVPLFTVPSTLLTLFFVPINSWNASMQSAYGESWTSGSSAWARAAFRQAMERTLLFGGLGVALFLALGDTFIRLWTQNRLWLGHAMAVSVAAIVVTSALVAAGEFLLTGLNRHRRAAVAELVNGVTTLVLVALAVRWIGPGAVGLGAVVAMAITSGWVLRREIRRWLGPDCFPRFSFWLRVCLAAAASSEAAAGMAGRASGADARTTVVHLISGATVGLALFTAAGVALRLVGMDDLAALGRRLSRRIHLPSAAPARDLAPVAKTADDLCQQ